MLRSNKKRLDVWKSILLILGWKWLVLTPLAALGYMQTIREEFIGPQEQDNFKLMNIVPDWPWEWWALIGLIITIFIVLESAYKFNKEMQTTLATYDDEIAMGLSFKEVRTEFMTVSDKAKSVDVRIGLVFRNMGRFPLKYEIENLSVILQDKTVANFYPLTKGNYVNPNSDVIYWCDSIRGVEISAPVLNGVVEYTVLYGHYNNLPTHKSSKKMAVEYLRSNSEMNGYDIINWMLIAESEEANVAG